MNAFEPHIRNKKNANLVMEILIKNGYEARFAGGCVRDHLLGLKAKDFDIATNALPEETIACFKKEDKFKTIPTGIEHGTITVVKSGFAYEVTTLREDVKTDGRHAEVLFGNSFEKDALRRDLTINALFMSKDGEILDHVGGQSDLKSKTLRFVGKADTRIKEDYLRILRFYRFKSRLNFKGTADCVEAIKDNANMLNSLSFERIWSELKLIFETLTDVSIFEDFVSYKLNKHIFGKDLEQFSKSLALYTTLSSEAKHFPMLGSLKLTIYLIENNLSEEDILNTYKKLKASRKEQDLALWCYRYFSKPKLDSQEHYLKALDELEKILTTEDFTKYGLIFLSIISKIDSHLIHSDLFKTLENLELTKHGLRKSKPLLTGDELSVKFGIPPGKKMGNLLKTIRSMQLNEQLRNKEDAIKWLKQDQN